MTTHHADMIPHQNHLKTRPSQVRQAADDSAGPLVQVVRQPHQCARLVPVQPQGRLQGGNQRAPFTAQGEGSGADKDTSAAELLAAYSGEHTRLLDVDAACRRTWRADAL